MTITAERVFQTDKYKAALKKCKGEKEEQKVRNFLSLYKMTFETCEYLPISRLLQWNEIMDEFENLLTRYLDQNFLFQRTKDLNILTRS